MISRKAKNRKKVISFVMRLVALIKPGELSLFQINIIRTLFQLRPTEDRVLPISPLKTKG